MKFAVGMLAFSLVVFASNGFAGAQPVCGTQTTSLGDSYNYCVHTGNRQKTQDVVYYFHGLWGNARQFFDQRRDTSWVLKRWAQLGYEPSVVTISFGEIWLLVNNQKFPLLPVFQNEMMPFLEGQVGGLGSGRRLLMGESMGGFNASQASLQLPAIFSKVALLCPALTVIGPYSSEADIDKYIARTKALRSRVNLMLGISREVFADEADWQNHNPFNLLTRYSGLIRPVFFVSTGLQDEFGFQEGSAEFVKAAQAVGMSATWSPLAGGHCKYNREAVAQFFLSRTR